ncbi:MAG: MBL fold metallo-hydrolase [Bacteroidota bacterium]|nr:MBL fold metallo-hydrolase [Bacteroidota bacterium]
MYIQQLYTGCLSEAAYYIEDQGEAAIIDPLRDIEEYLLIAKERKATIKYIFETHFHADFVSGHLDLAQASGAPIIYGPQTETSFPIYKAKDGEQFKLGGLTIEVLHTPGHTLESSCYLLKDANGKDHAIFTGDTLFVGDVGRPDLSSGNLNKEELAGMLYDSLQQKIRPLSDEVIVYPAHGQGSSCGKNLGPDTYSTLGEERKTNYALKQQSREEFIKSVTEGLNVAPQYFSINARINKEGYESLDGIIENALRPLSPEDFKKLMGDDDTIVLDTRNASLFTEGYIPGSISIGLDGRFAEWAGSLLPFDKPLLLVTEPGREKESAVRLARVGFDQMKGCLKGGFEAWKSAGERADLIINVDADELAMDIRFDPKLLVVDVRRETEYGDGHLAEARNIPLETLTDPGTMADFNDTDNIYLHCASGYRSVIAASLFKRQGIHNLRNIMGGFEAIRELGGFEIVKENSVLN